MYAVKKIDLKKLNIRDLVDLKKWTSIIRNGIDNFINLMQESYMDVFPSEERKAIVKRLDDALGEVSVVDKNTSKAMKLNIGGIDLSSVTPTSMALLSALTLLGLATQQFISNRFNLALAYRILRETSINAYNADKILEKLQGPLKTLNKKQLSKTDAFELFEDEGHHDRLLDAVGMIFKVTQKIDSSRGTLSDGIDKKRLNKAVYKHLNPIKKSAVAVYDDIKAGKVPSDKDVELLIVKLTTLLEGINDLSADINRATDADLNSRLGATLHAFLGNHIKFGG